MKLGSTVKVNSFMSSFRAKTEKQQKLAVKGLLRGGLLLQRLSQKLAPRDTGNMARSAFTRQVAKKNPEVQVGYTAAYAIYVHENLDARHAEGKQAKFLEAPARDHMTEIRQEIANTIMEGTK